ncbi:two-component system sensor histidine kinase YesM [Paenibacillus phyllosphaerae]|uniref:histidine kinase n=1 Tax=Paenibacillus phyllosphaerae TaxID=274593 RepID=A0A7W5FKJ9_9BACL|nr:two-component system sensor histidine kinase YesM [Paenibacillus phyllosphaerae]
MAFSYVVFNKISTNSAQNKLNEASLQTLTSIQTNVDLMVGNVNNYSKMIFSDDNLQNLLRQGNVYADLQTQSKVSMYLNNLMQAVPIIDSVYIFDNSGNRFSVGTQQSPTFARANVHDAEWYSQVVAEKGKYILRLNGSGAFTESSDSNFVSFIRLIRDMDDTSPLGVLVINIKGEAFVQAYANLPNQNALQIAILDENNQIIAANSTDDDRFALMKQIMASDEQLLNQTLLQQAAGNLSVKSDSQTYTVSFLSEGSFNWKFVSVTPHNLFRTVNKSLVLLALMLLIINGVVFFVTSFIISRSIIHPIHQLLRSMKKAQSGSLRKVPAATSSYEFEQLFIGYNNMIEQIDQLLKRIIEEQKTIRKAELNTLQAQIKPHFLYNTLDSITSLAMSGLNDQVCDLLEALGSYYRMSVSKGRDIITIGEEIDMVRNYLKIQKARYQDIFEVEYDVDESCCPHKILKLVLQPLVENSLYHGIRSKGMKGTIRISAHHADGMLRISVADDGIGMSEEEVARIVRPEGKGQIESFGLWGTLERLRIFYGDRSSFKIESEPGKGTVIALFIPLGGDTSWTS